MTPAKLEKIRRLAEDIRGDPATRMIAREILARYQTEPSFSDVEPEPEPKNPPNPRMRNSDEYERHMFMSLSNWGRVKATGNFVHTATHKGRGYRIVLFKHKRTPTYGWLRVDAARNQEVWSGRFNSLPEAHKDAWECLMKI
jgi:hypothetical protein